jgi:hypothetical protein
MLTAILPIGTFPEPPCGVAKNTIPLVESKMVEYGEDGRHATSKAYQDPAFYTSALPVTTGLTDEKAHLTLLVTRPPRL